MKIKRQTDTTRYLPNPSVGLPVEVPWNTTLRYYRIQREYDAMQNELRNWHTLAEAAAENAEHVHDWVDCEIWCEICGSHLGVRCTIDGCPGDYDVAAMDLTFNDNPRETP